MGEESNDLNDQTDIEVYPNPCTDVVTVRLNEGTSSVTLVNVLGEIITLKENKHSEGITILNTKDLSPGVYFLIIESKAGRVTKRVVKN
jgi:hypothetical protein